MKSILVTGVTGFLGSHVANALVHRGFLVHGTKRSTSSFASLSGFVDAITFHDVDRIEDAEWLDCLPPLQAILHFATSYGKEPNHALQVFKTNTLFPLILLQRAIEQKISLFLNTDTCYEVAYGHLQAYTLSKQQFRQWGETLSKNSNIRFINLKLFHPYGPGDRPDKFVPWIIHQCRGTAGEIALTKGEQKKDFIYVDDVVNAVLAILDKQEMIEPGFNEFECGTGKSISVRQFVESVHQQTDSHANLQFGGLPYRENEVMFSQADIRKLEEIGWHPETALEVGIRRTLQATSRHAKLN